MQRNYDFIFKIVLVGPSQSGKTSLLRRFVDQQFQEPLVPTIGVDFRFKSINVDGMFIKLQIWDTAGQERFRSLTETYYRGAHAIIVVYDVKNTASFDIVKDYWLPKIIKKHKYASLFCFANKCDKHDQHSSIEQRKYFETQQLPTFEMSAMTGQNVHNTFYTLVQYLTSVCEPQVKAKTLMQLSDIHLQLPKKKCC